MKRISTLLPAILLLATCILFSYCTKNEKSSPPCEEEGILLGPDPARCSCCVGWFIRINNDTLRAWTLPEDFTERLDTLELPLPVTLDWNYSDLVCLGDEIEVSCIQRQ